MSFSSWLRSWKSTLAPASSGKPRRLHRSRPAPSTRLGVEGLEDRSLPSVSQALLANIFPPAPQAAALAAPTTDTHVVPVQVTGEGGTTVGLPVFIGGTASYFFSGTASHLGRYTGEGVFKLLSLDPTTGTGTFQASFVFVAANGDRLAMDTGATPGTFQLTPTADGSVVAQFTGTFSPVPALSTGRFANATEGSITLVATSSPISLETITNGYTEPFTMTWGGEGSLVFGTGK